MWKCIKNNIYRIYTSEMGVHLPTKGSFVYDVFLKIAVNWVLFSFVFV